MSEIRKTDIACPTPRCVERVKNFGNGHSRVYKLADASEAPKFMPEAIARCEGCGGYTDEKGNWKHNCARCGKEVAPGKLTGLFVPHHCSECMTEVRNAEIAAGHICRFCGKPYCDCCC